MSEKKQLNDEQLEKVSGGGTRDNPKQLTMYSVLYTTDGSDTPYTESFGDENGETVIKTNCGYHYLGWFKTWNEANTSGQNWCSKNNVHFISVIKGYHES